MVSDYQDRVGFVSPFSSFAIDWGRGVVYSVLYSGDWVIGLGVAD